MSLVCGSCTEREKASVETASGVAGPRGRERERAEAETEGIEYRSRRSLADRPVVAVKPCSLGWGWSEGAGSSGMSIRSTGAVGSREEARKHAKAEGQVVCDSQADGVGGVAAGQGQQGRPGVDGQDLDEFEADLRDNLYKIWNRMSSGTWFPPPVRAVEIPKPHGDGVRLLGVPTIADRVAQTVVAMFLGPLVEPRFHPDSYGYRPRQLGP